MSEFLQTAEPKHGPGHLWRATEFRQLCGPEPAGGAFGNLDAYVIL